MFFAQAPLRGVRGVARDYPPCAVGSAEEAGALRRAAPGPLPGIPQAVRIHPVSEGPRPLSDHHVDRALGRYPYGRFTRTADASPTQDLRSHVRPRDGMLGMQRTAFREGRACASRPWRPEVLTSSREGHRHQGKGRIACGKPRTLRQVELGVSEFTSRVSPNCSHFVPVQWLKLELDPDHAWKAPGEIPATTAHF